MKFSTLNLITEFQHIIPLSISDENIYICKYQKMCRPLADTSFLRNISHLSLNISSINSLEKYIVG